MNRRDFLRCALGVGITSLLPPIDKIIKLPKRGPNKSDQDLRAISWEAVIERSSILKRVTHTSTVYKTKRVPGLYGEQIELTPHKLFAYTRKSNSKGILEALVWAIDYSLLCGSGVGQPLGAITKVKRETQFHSIKQVRDEIYKCSVTFPPSTALMLSSPNHLGYNGWPEAIFGMEVVRVPGMLPKNTVALVDWKNYVVCRRHTYVAMHKYSDMQKLVARLDGAPFCCARVIGIPDYRPLNRY